METMVELTSDNLFLAVKNAQDAGLLKLLPAMNGRIEPGDRFFESFQRYLLDTFDLEQLDLAFYNLAPAIQFMADPSHWEPGEFTSDEMFAAVLHLQKMGVLRILKTKQQIPGAGDRFFEYYQRILVEKIGVETMDRLLAILAQCIRFLASEEAMENVAEGAVVHASSVSETESLCSSATAIS